MSGIPDSTNTRRARVDTGDEQVAYLIAHFGEAGSWTVISQQLAVLADGREIERVDLTLESGEQLTIEFFGPVSSSPFEDEFESEATRLIPQIMAVATAFSEANPPHHPGTLARFPVPSRAYARSLSVPMAVLALDQGQRGLYSPPRQVVVSFDTHEVRGVSELPDFDPETWPPPRIGNWPPPGLVGRSPERIQQTMARFSAVWSRLLDGWFANEVVDSPDVALDAAEAIELLAMLDLESMQVVYQRLNPVFWKWLQRHAVR